VRDTIKRLDSEGVMIVGATESKPPAYLSALREAEYDVSLVATASEASALMPERRPHVVILSPSVPMPEHRVVHEIALAVSALVLVIPNDARPSDVHAEVSEGIKKATRKRSKTIPPAR
jgi:hypothetical protein